MEKQRLADQFTYTTASSGPVITGVSPSSGAASGGYTVQITGSGFTGTANVSFGAATSSFTIVSDSLINAVAPAGSPGTVHVQISSSHGFSPLTPADLFTYTSGGFAPLAVAGGPSPSSTLHDARLVALLNLLSALSGGSAPAATNGSAGGAAATTAAVPVDLAFAVRQLRNGPITHELARALLSLEGSYTSGSADPPADSLQPLMAALDPALKDAVH